MTNAKKPAKRTNTKPNNSKSVRATRTRRVTHNAVVAASVDRMYRRGAPVLLCEALLFIAASLVLFIRPVLVLTIFTYIIGAALLIFGLYRMIGGFVSSNDSGGGLDVVFGVINIVLGLLFIVYPSGSLVSVAYIFVVLFFVKAIRVLIFAINLVRARFGHYLVALGAACVLFLLAVALFFFPLGTFIAMTYYLAALLMIYAAADVYMFIELSKLRQLV